MKKLSIIAALIVVFVSCVGCEWFVQTYWGSRLANNSDKDVLFTISFSYDGDKYRPTTDFPDSTWKLLLAKAHEERAFMLVSKKVKERDSDSIAVFVFDPDTVRKYSWKQITEDRNCLKIYKMTCKELPGGTDAIQYP